MTEPTAHQALERKTFAERAFHATLYEAIAIVLCAPVAAWAMGTSLPKMGVLTLAFSAIAMVWNIVFNSLFDAAQRRWAFERTFSVRVLHGVLFECGMFAMAIPLAAWWLAISLWQAFLLDGALLLFFLPYTVAFNWAYDTLRARRMRRMHATPALPKA
jgi:uncharacterized membrane protein